MNSRERVRKALRFQEPDRVPIDFGGCLCTSICIDPYIELVKHLGLDLGLPNVIDQMGMMARIAEPVRRRMHSDVIELENPFGAWGLENKDWKPWTTGPGNAVLMPGAFNPVVDEKGYLHVCDAKTGKSLGYMPPGGLYFDRACVTTMSAKSDEKMSPEQWVATIPLYTDEHLRQLEETARRIYETTEYSIVGGFLQAMLGSNGIFAGHTITDWLCRLLTEPDYAFSLLQATAERAIENIRVYLQAVGKFIDAIFMSGTDWGTQKGELISPATFKELYVPNIKRMTDYVHQHSDAKTLYHCCGSIFNLMEHFIEAGVDCLNPIQTTAARMNPVELKKRFGGRIVFWGGGVETQTVLPHGTPEEVREQVKERLRIFAPGGGFIFSHIHDIQYGVPPENMLAMADTAWKYGNYPIDIQESDSNLARDAGHGRQAVPTRAIQNGNRQSFVAKKH
jgi:uroporphyrinogen decarboxylase